MTEEVIRQQYEQMAQHYDRRWSTYISKTLSFLDAWTAISPQAVVLDIGCGTGEFEKLVLNKLEYGLPFPPGGNTRRPLARPFCSLVPISQLDAGFCQEVFPSLRQSYASLGAL